MKAAARAPQTLSSPTTQARHLDVRIEYVWSESGPTRLSGY